VRKGAVSDCPKCSHRFLVKPEVVRHELTAAPTGESPDALLPPTTPLPQTSAPSADEVVALAEDDEMVDPNEETAFNMPSPVGAEDAPAKGRAASPAGGGKPVGVGAIKPGPKLSASMLLAINRRNAARRRMTKLLALAVGAMGMLLLVMAFILFGEPPDDNVGVQSIAIDTPVVQSESLESAKWLVIKDEPYRESGVVSHPLRMEGEVLPSPQGGLAFTGQLVCNSFDLIESANGELILLDDQSRVYARRPLRYSALSGRAPLKVYIPIPAELGDRFSRFAVRLEPGRRVSNAVAFVSPEVRPMAEGYPSGVQITAWNPLNRPIKRSLFVLTAYDDAERPIGRWSMTFAREVEAKQRVEFVAMLSAEDRQPVHRWGIEGVALENQQD